MTAYFALQGYKQKIQIPLKLMLKKVMASLKSPSEPMFRYVKFGELAYKASMQLDVSTTFYTVSETGPIIVIHGNQCASPEFAEESAAREAF